MNQQPNYPQQPGQQPAAPQWEQPQTIPTQQAPVYQPPVPGTENYLHLPQPTQEIRPPEANGTSFIPDIKTKEILDRTYPELTNALISLAIKKFSEDPDYVAYFVREEFKQMAQESVKEEKKTTPEVSNSGSDFSTW